MQLTSTSAPLSPFADLPDSLKRTVQLFKVWAEDNPTNAAQERMSVRQLFEELGRFMRTIPPIAGEQVLDRGSAANHLTMKKTRNQPWWALCYWALQLYDDEDTAPAPLRYFAGEYAKRLGWPSPTTPPGSDGSAAVHHPNAAKMIQKLQRRLEDYDAKGAEVDLAGFSSTAERLASLLFTALHQTSSDDASHALDKSATETAENLCNLADSMTAHFDAAEDHEVTDDIRRSCAQVFDSAIHAHRRLARTAGRESKELGRLAALRERDIRITGAIRTNVERAFMRYHSTHSGSLLRERGEPQLQAEIAAARELVSKLTTLKKAAPSRALGVVRLDGRRPPADDIADIDRLVGVACRLACALACAVREDRAAEQQFTALRMDLVNLFPRGHERHDVRWLLTLATGPDDAVKGASEILRVARIRGVGDYLLARMFVAASTTDEAAIDVLHRSRYRLFHPPDVDLLRRVARPDEGPQPGEDPAHFHARLREQRRAMILQRAAGLYERAIGWLRESGSAGQLRLRAQHELAAVNAELSQWQIERDPSSVVHALGGLRHRLHEMTIDGFLWADIGAFTNMKDDKVGISARRLSAVLEQTQRYLSQPELGTVAET